MNNKAKMTFTIGAILTLIVGVCATFLSFNESTKYPIDNNPISPDSYFFIFGFVFLMITIFFVTILLGLPLLKNEK